MLGAMDPTGPLSREQQRSETRTALLESARRVFADRGYHQANLAAIAREAGYSKGAVYSNFANKAELFLAVMDLDLAKFDQVDAWDPFSPDGIITHDHEERAAGDEGFSLATLEFIATAARDPELGEQLAERVHQLLDRYMQTAQQAQDPDDQLAQNELAALLGALDQGIGLLAIAGVNSIDATLMREGLRRLTNPVRAANTVTPARDAASGTG